MDDKEFSIVKNISKLNKLFNKLFQKKTNSYKKIKILYYFFQVLETLEMDLDTCLSILDIFCRKLNKLEIDKKHIREKIYSKNAYLYIKHYTPLKFVNWLFVK